MQQIRKIKCVFGGLLFVVALLMNGCVMIGVETPLMIASEKGEVQAVGELIDGGADVDARYKPKGSALCMASAQGHADVVRRLLEADADVELCDENNVSPLLYAIEGQHVEVVRLLLDAGADVNAGGKGYVFVWEKFGGVSSNQFSHVFVGVGGTHRIGATGVIWQVWPLFLAAQNNEVEVVKLLLEAGANVNDPTAGMCEIRPLWIASQNGNVEVVKLLLTAVGGEYIKGYSAHIYGYNMNSLKIAKLKDRQEVIEVLSE